MTDQILAINFEIGLVGNYYGQNLSGLILPSLPQASLLPQAPNNVKKEQVVSDSSYIYEEFKMIYFYTL